MIGINITAKVQDTTQIKLLLLHIVNLIERGYSRGFDPNWSLVDDEDEDEEE